MSVRPSIRVYIAILVAAVLAFPLAFGGLVIVRSGEQQDAIAINDLRDRASMAASDVDRELATLRPLGLLARNKLLAVGDFAGFYALATGVLRPRGLTGVLTDLSGQQIVNTRVPFGEPLPSFGNPEALARVVEGDQVYISDLTVGAQSRAPVLTMNFPVRLNNKIVYVLTVSLLPALADVMAKQHLADQMTSGLFDRNDVTIARNKNDPLFVGQTAPPDLAKAMKSSDEGLVFGTPPGGVPLVGAFRRVATTGWTVVIGSSRKVVFAASHRSLIMLALIGGGTVLVSLLIGALIGRRIAVGVSRLSQMAAALQAGKQPSMARAPTITEIDSVAEALIHASATIAHRTEEQELAYAALEAAMAERKRLESKLLQAKKMEVVGQLTGGVAHDFNNLLGIVIGNIDFLSEKFAPASVEYELADAAMKAATHGAALTRQLLAFAQRQPLAPQLTDIRSALEPAIELMRTTIGDDITVELSIDEPIWPVRIDIAELEAALLNLGRNARDAMLNGGYLTVTAENRVVVQQTTVGGYDAPAGDYVLVTVADTGTGMESQALGRAFEPFFTTKGPSASGLGLSMVHGFVMQSGGFIDISSEPGQGTTVALYLPRASARGAAPEAEGAGFEAVATEERTVLVVEANPGMRDLALRQIRGLGYQTLDADDGAEALEILRGDAPIDLLFTDIVVPGGMDGRDLAAAARVSRPQLKILFSSGFTAAAASAATGVPLEIDLLQKPYRKAELARRIRAAFGVSDANTRGTKE